MPSRPELSYLLQAFPDPCVVVTPDLRVVTANDEFLAATGTESADILSRGILDEVFPDPTDPEGAEGRRLLRGSIAAVLESGQPHAAAVHRYDVDPGRRNKPRPRYWSVVTSPVSQHGDSIEYLMIRVQDVTANRGLLATALAEAQSALDHGTPPAVDLQRLTASLLEAERRGQSNAQLADQVEALAEVLAARTVIEQAKGMLMAGRSLTADEAYQVLVAESQRRNVKLRDVAAHHVLLHGAALMKQRAPLPPEVRGRRQLNRSPIPLFDRDRDDRAG